jgi:HEPN domain-containing protein
MPDRPERLGRLVDRWLTLADEDMQSARRMAADGSYPERLVCLLCQQAAEKAIKGALVAEDIDPPKAHGLTPLLEQAGVAIDVGGADVDWLSRWSVAGRYPADVDNPIEPDGTRAIEIAGAIVDAAKSRAQQALDALNQEGG